MSNLIPTGRKECVRGIIFIIVLPESADIVREAAARHPSNQLVAVAEPIHGES